MAGMSNRDRIARAAEEARLAEAEKVANKASSRAARRPGKARGKEVRMKIVWVVCNSYGKPVRTFAYPDKAVAETEVQRLSRSTGYPHGLRATKVPMD